MPNPTGITDFFRNSQSALFASICTHDTSGCTQFCASLAKPFKAELALFKLILYSDGDIGLKGITKAADKSYKSIVITGCSFEYAAPLITELLYWYDCSNVKQVYIVVPPHLAAIAKSDQLIFAGNLPPPVEITVLFAGISLDETSPIIGLPNPLAETKLEAKEFSLPDDCLGFMYINEPEIGSKEKYHNYLKAYFKQLSMIANQQVASVIVIGNKDREMIEAAAAFKITIQFQKKLPFESFISILRQMSQRKGLVALNGTQALLEAMALGCAFFCYLNIQLNKSFLEELLATVPQKNKDRAACLLGLDETYPPQDPNKMGELALHFQKTVKQAVDKFDSLRTLSPKPSKCYSRFFQAAKPQLPAESPPSIGWQILLFISHLLETLSFSPPLIPLIVHATHRPEPRPIAKAAR